MNLLSSLNSGFPAAANGTAEIYIRGSSTRATWYPDFEASSSNSSGADITLDAYGSALVYVNQLVDVVVKDADGNAVRSYGDGYASPNIEVISPAFTGTDYVTAASAVSEPTTLQAVLDRWETNAGAPDWKVDIGGADTTMLNAFGALLGLVYNVKSPAYGAVGDGVTNDQSAIAAAMAAAVAAGGGIVFFPKGTYRITTAIVWSPLVSIAGVGMDLSILSIDAASESILRFTAANTSDTPTRVVGMAFQAAQANSTTEIELTSAGAFVEFDHCAFAKSTNSTGLSITVGHASARLRCIECHFNWRSTTIGVYQSTVQAASVLFERCRATAQTAASFNGDVFLTRGTTEFRDCVIDYSASVVAGTSRIIDVNNSSDFLSVTGCRFNGVGGATITGIDLVADSFVVARSNYFNAVTARYAIASGVILGGFLELRAAARDSGSGTAYTVTADTEVWELTSSGTAPVITMSDGFQRGQRKTLILINTNAGAWSPVAYSGSVSKATALAATAVPAGNTVASSWVWSDTAVSGTYVWMKIAEI